MFYLLNTKTTINAATAEGQFVSDDTVLYVLRSNKRPGSKPIVASSHSELGEFSAASANGFVPFRVGQIVGVTSDNNGHRYLGGYTVEGIRYANGAVEGTVPSQRLAHWVAK